MKLNDLIYIVDDNLYNLFLIKGRIQNIQKTTYEHFKDYSDSGEIETKDFYKYSVHGHSGWYHKDKCFETEKEAKEYLKHRIQKEIKNLEEKLK